MNRPPVIGVVGGMGPYAGLDLVRKIFDDTVAVRDQDHLPVVLHSLPGRIVDRSAYVFGQQTENPAAALLEIALGLERAGATVAGMPCNTAHVPAIFDVLRRGLDEAGSRLRMLNLIDETIRSLQTDFSGVRRVGILSTLAVYRLGLYEKALREAGFEVVLPGATVQENIVNRTIFDPTYGIKAQSNPVSPIARQSLLNTIEDLRNRGAEAVVLGCTELPLAIPEPEVNGVLTVDTTRVLARALIRETYPDRLRPL